MVTTKIKRIKDKRLYPRDKVAYLKENPDIWAELKAYKIVEIPADIFKELKGVEIVVEKAPKKKEIENKINKDGDD